MDIEFDPAKDARNRLKHRLSFEDFSGFDAEPFVEVDERRDYGEVRLRAFGRIEGSGYAIAFAPLSGGRIRLISFRRAHEKEMRRYE